MVERSLRSPSHSRGASVRSGPMRSAPGMHDPPREGTELAPMSLPPIARVRQHVRQPEVEDVPSAVALAIRKSRIAARIPPGGSVAVTVGSRGIAGLDAIVRATVDTLRSLGFAPCVVAAMGSHGGG